MKANSRQDKVLLLKTARAIVKILWERSEGTSLRVRWPSRVGQVNTGGWRACIGDLGKGKPKLQIWLDYFAGHETRKFNFCFFLDSRAKMLKLAKRAARELPEHRRITHKHLEEFKRKGFYFLKERLRKNEFGPAIFEEYWDRWCYFGIYDVSPRSVDSQINPKLCARGASFFESVARAQPNATPENAEREVYPQIENRKLVVSHLRRERSSYLANERKIHDEYKCQACGFDFEKVYGEIGTAFAESHHRVPLHRLSGKVKTRMEDLATVCANCHRILHKMAGNFDDVEKLKSIVRQRRRRSG
jgi:5-methylcytosine-specific restriction endonuclease McrA